MPVPSAIWRAGSVIGLGVVGIDGAGDGDGGGGAAIGLRNAGSASNLGVGFALGQGADEVEEGLGGGEDFGILAGAGGAEFFGKELLAGGGVGFGLELVERLRNFVAFAEAFAQEEFQGVVGIGDGLFCDVSGCGDGAG